ncbi:MAG TPA: hypothetical protein VGE74_04405 [Gemmata sp.]
MNLTAPEPRDGGIQFRCARCLRAAGVTADEALRYLREGWPFCCGSLMTYSGAAPQTGPGTNCSQIKQT